MADVRVPSASGGDRIRTAIASAAARFASPTARLDAELLMAHALGVTRDRLLMAHLDDPEPAGFAILVERRIGHEPVAYITGARGFWTIDLAVGPGALVPRADSETLIEAAIAHFGARVGAGAPATILDLGTGPGTLLLAALDHWPEARGLGVDRSAAALDYARRNARRQTVQGLRTRADFVLGDWGNAIAGTFDLVLTNPPYVAVTDFLPTEVRAHEPAAALFAGTDGLDAYRALAAPLRRLVAPGGAAVIEIGATQAPAVTALMEAQGFAVQCRDDLGGRPRALIAT